MCGFHTVMLPAERIGNFLSFKEKPKMFTYYYTMTLQFDGNFNGILI